MRLSRHSLLSLDFDIASDAHVVRIIPNHAETFETWGPHTRVSPIWLYSGASEPNALLTEADIGLAFISSINPATFLSYFGNDLSDSEEFGNIWISLGSFNLIVVLRQQDGAARLEELCRDQNLAMELWVFDQGQFEGQRAAHMIGRMDYYPPTEEANDNSLVRPFIREIERTEEHFKSSVIELTALLAMALKRSAYQLPALTADFETLSEVAFDFLTKPAALRRDTHLGEPERSRILEGLHNINAGLSRLTSQALSGASPIAKTECHFWPHSLLGIGTANRALRNIVAYISNIFQEYAFSDRINEMLKLRVDFDGPAGSIPFADLARPGKLDEIEPDTVRSTIIPITYFSGRDGFKNSGFTTSAPLMSIQAGNGYQYSLVTITHEVSHRIVAATIAKMVKMFEGKRLTYAAICENVPLQTKTYGEVFLEIYVMSLTYIAEEHAALNGEDWQTDPYLLESLFADFGEDFEEHMVHVFDFWYFFDRNVTLYITTIWCSWAVIPNISARVEEYVVRTLVALSANNVGKKDWLGESRNEMRAVFEHLKKGATLHLADQVLDILADEALFDQIGERVRTRMGVIRAFHHICKSEKLAAKLVEEPLPSKRPKKGRRRSDNLTRPDQNYPFSSREFSLTRFGNAIRFLNQYSADERADPTKSAWILLMLAFNLYEGKEHG